MISFRAADTGSTVALHEPSLVVVGYSGRDPDIVRAHVEELARHGIPRPVRVPAVWRLPGALVRQDDVLRVDTSRTSGEAEPVLVFANGRTFVTVGSDHTDRELERTSLEDAKRACPKFVATECWEIDSVRARWDELELRATIGVNGVRRDYQRGRLGALLPVAWFLDRFSREREAVVFCGTVPVIGDIDCLASSFRAELGHPSVGAIACEYAIETTAEVAP